MKKDRFERWLNNIFTTEETEISCSECFDLVSSYVELEFSGGNPQSTLPEVHHHLAQCRACRDEYEALRDLRGLDESAGQPSEDDSGHSIQ
jgi:predicted anti-sigma-YlaC factor YlaD